ncbi:hydroxyacid dehydrogenase [Pseudomonas putida]|uniref:Hydroxyacid dehydrogenase n=1 Tax=Pseudomonas putida TaxID=303 RepID=A0A2Z4RHH5_PSEPU|nr:DNA circularization N-terminal domain-containing protein [Pseudomonas putida]AWY39414.1 hydroxyacid dehydrogenase [Pseudomonas putida]
MTGTWRDQLLPASFRGVSFLIPQTSVPVGMKGQLHEFPQRDNPYFEQLGKQSQVHKMTGWVIGDDCFERRDKLIEALNKPGGGELVHPWLGRLQVKAGECEVSHDLMGGGMVSFDLTFYPDEPLKTPAARVNTQAQVANSSESLLTSSLNRYETGMAKVNKARLGLLQMRNSLSNVFSVIQQHFAPFASVFSDSTGFAQSLMNSPSGLSSLFSSYFSSFTGFDFFKSSSGGGSNAGSGYRAAVAEVTQQTEAASSINTVSPVGGANTVAASQATANLVQDAVLVQIGLIVSEMPVATQPEPIGSTAPVEQQALQPVIRPEVPVADDVIDLRDSLNEVIHEASLKADPQHFVVLNTFRQNVMKHLTAVAQSGVRLVDITPAETLPALVLAYRRFGDATRSTEVVQRNRIRHPGFVPATPIKIAQR